MTISSKNLYCRDNQLFILLVLWQIFTFIYYFVSPYSARLTNVGYLLIATLSFYLLPQILFFNFGAILRKEVLAKVALFYVHINLFAIIIGTIDFFTLKLLYRAPHILGVIPLNGYFRMQSYFGTPMITGCVCATSLLISVALIQNKFRKFIFAFVFLLGLMLTMARGAWVAGLISLGYYLFMSKSIKVKLSLRVIGFIIMLIVFLIIFSNQLYNYFNSENFVQLQTRFRHLSTASEERKHQWINGINVFLKYPWGVGYGLLTHKGIMSNFGIRVPDGNYFRILGELGVIGFSLFVSILTYAIYISHKRRYYIVTALLIIYCIQAIGTNVLDLAYTSFLFWLLIGFSLNINQKEGLSQIQANDRNSNP